MKWAVAVGGLGMLAVTALTPMLMTSTMGMATSGGTSYTCSTAGPAPLPVGAGAISATVAGRTVTLDPGQAGYARTIIETGQNLKVPERGWVVAIATALQESTLKNLAWGDRDSVGLFQQRRRGWGTKAQRTDPATAARMFYEGGFGGAPGLMDIAGWQLVPIGVAAQKVQVSAFPTAYAKWEELAGKTVAALTGDAAPAPEPTCTPEPQVPAVAAGQFPLDHLPEIDRASNGQIPVSLLAAVPWAKGHHLRPDALNDLVPLDAAYKERFGEHLCITDSYRTLAEQVHLYATKPGLAAVPGTSNHGLARALDLCGGIQNFDSPEHFWLAAHGPDYGWRNPPWAVRGGSRPEPWHFSWRTDN